MLPRRESSTAWWACGFTPLLLLLGSGSLAQAESQPRRWLPAPVLQASIVYRNGTLLGNPKLMVSLPAAGFALVDDYVTVLAFDSAGESDWTFGRYGEGPHEFNFIQDIDVSSGGEVFVLDRQRGRASVIDGRTGRSIASFPVPRTSTASAYGILPGYREARALVISQEAFHRTLWLSLSQDGLQLRTEPMPELISLACDHHLACEFFTTVTGSRGGAVAFRWSSKLLFLEAGGSVRTLVDGVEEIPFPGIKTYDNVGAIRATVTRVDPQAPTAVLDITADSSHLFVSFGGLTEESRHIVDVYSVVDGGYRGSYLFPEDINLNELTILSDGRLATLDVDYLPTVHLWELSW